MIDIIINKDCLSEKKYILDVIFRNYFGQNYNLKYHNEKKTIIINNGYTTVFNDIFFQKVKDNWLSNIDLNLNSLSYINLNEFNLNLNNRNDQMPLIFGKNKIEFNNRNIFLDFDLFGSCFFLMTGYEEVINLKRDEYGRFLAKYSLAEREDFLSRPIVDEYIDFLWSILIFQNKNLIKKKHNYSMIVTADVDLPYNYEIKSIFGVIKSFIKSIRDLNLSYFFNVLNNSIKYKFGLRLSDKEYLNFEWMMDLNKKLKNEMIFFFIVNKTNKKMDGFYDINEEPIQDLISRIKKNHKLGLHFSFETFKNLVNIKKEVNIFNSSVVCNKIIQSRQHFLRWSSIYTPYNLNASAVNYDYSFGFSDKPGFRAGTCHEFQMYDLVNRKSLELIQVPLIVMEVSVFSEKNMNLPYDQSTFEYINDLKSKCKQYNGKFTLLWHNNQFPTNESKKFYSRLVK